MPFDWPKWVAAGRTAGMSPREVFDLTPASFISIMDNSAPPSKEKPLTRRGMLNMMRQADGRP